MKFILKKKIQLGLGFVKGFFSPKLIFLQKTDPLGGSGYFFVEMTNCQFYMTWYIASLGTSDTKN